MVNNVFFFVSVYALIDQNRDSLVYSYAFSDSQQSTQLQVSYIWSEFPSLFVFFRIKVDIMKIP